MAGSGDKLKLVTRDMGISNDGPTVHRAIFIILNFAVPDTILA